MANVNLSNLARMTVSSSGTGTITLNAAVPGFLTFDLSGLSTAAAGSVVRYAINDTTQSEIAYGTYTSSALSLTRGSSTTGMKSTNSNSPINMSASAQVFVTEAAADFPFVMDTGGTSATSSIALTLTAALTLSAALTYGGVTLSNAVTGTGNMVLSASPTFTGTTTIATLALTSVGAHTITGAITYGGVALNNAVTGTGNMVLSASPTFTGTVTIATLALTTVGAHTISGAITYGGVALNNAVTGTGNMVLSASPTFTGTVTFAGGTTINGSGDYVNSLTGQHLIAATHASGSIVVFAGDAVTARLSISSTQFHITNVTEVVSFCAANFFSAASVNVTANATAGQPYFVFQISGSAQSHLTDDGGNIIVSSNSGQTAGMYIVHGASSWTAISDARLPYKRTARPLSVLNRLDSFRLYENEVNGRTELFVEAQEFHKVLPHLVKVGDDDESFVPEKSTDPRAWGVSYDRAGVAALMAVKELRDEVRAALRRP